MRILVVEDQEETAALLKRKLEAECYAVESVFPMAIDENVLSRYTWTQGTKR